MGAAMGENPEIVEEVVRLGHEGREETGVGEDDAERDAHHDPSRAAFRGGCEGVSAINTIRSVMGVNLDTLRPEPASKDTPRPAVIRRRRCGRSRCAW